MPSRYHVQFPPVDGKSLGQDEVYFYVIEDGEKRRLRFHDYAEIYKRQGLYEQLFYDRLRCNSPKKVADILKRTLDACDQSTNELRVLDLGAGNGMMGEALQQHGVSRLVGTDIIPAARDACFRDRPTLYDEYYVADFTKLAAQDIAALEDWSIDCLTSVAALGFGDIPPAAFSQALRFVKPGGWVAFNIKETFLDESDTTGFSRFIRQLIFSEYLDVYHLEKYRHRYSIEGVPLFYFAVVGQKAANIPDDFLLRHEIFD